MATPLLMKFIQKGACTKALSSIATKQVCVPRVLASSPILSHQLGIREAHSGDHSKLWNMEKIVSASLIGIVPLAIAVPNPALDYVLALSLPLHAHWGIEAIVADYVRESIFGSVIPKIAIGMVYLMSIMCVGGLFYFNYTDVGLGQSVRMIWKL